MLHPQSPHLQTPSEFLDDFITMIGTARESVYIQSMNFEAGNALQRLADALIEASLRGITVKIHRDWVADVYVHGDIPILPIKDPKKKAYADRIHRQNRELSLKMEAAGIHITIMNTPSFPFSLFPIKGRNHMKMYIVDKEVAWIGGVNLLDQGFLNADIMVKYTDRNIITPLYQQFDLKNLEKKDFLHVCTDDTTMIIDGGKPGKSLIYINAIQLVKKAAKTITFMSQFLPDTFLFHEMLKKAKNGCSVTIITSPTTASAFSTYPQKFLYLYFLFKLKFNPNVRLIHLKQKVHAKLLLVDEHEAMFGSHNLTLVGVVLGTAEIMIKTKQVGLIDQFRKFLYKTLSA